MGVLMGSGLTTFTERRNRNTAINFSDRRISQRQSRQNQVRHQLRQTLKVPVSLILNGGELSGHTEDLSQNGLCLFSDTLFPPGAPLVLRFQFEGDIQSVSVSGKAIYSRAVEQEGVALLATGIAFSRTKDTEEELQPKTIPFDSSLLAIHIYDDTSRQKSDRRLAPRLANDIPTRINRETLEGRLLNLSEGGICLVSETPIPLGEVIFTMEPSTSDPDPIQLSATIVWSRQIKGTFQAGARCSRLEGSQASYLRGIVFEGYANKAAAMVRYNEDLKKRVHDFFTIDVRQYHEALSSIAEAIDHPEVSSKQTEETVTKLTNDLLLKGDTLEQVDEISIKKIKPLFRQAIGCWIYKSEIMKMAIDKPRGYPGDYALFEIMYEGHPLSKGIGFIFDEYFLNNTYSMAARSRKEKMKEILKQFLKEPHSSTVNLLSIACGPCRDIRELLAEPIPFSERNLLFTGLDNDEGALDFARTCLQELPPNVKIRLIRENVLNLFRDPKSGDLLGKQDIIYILGLTEYLPDRIFKNLVYFLFGQLNEKGLLVISYKDKNIPLPGIPPSWLCDWDFIKRDEQDLIRVAKGLGEGRYSIKIDRESTGCIFFMQLRKIKENE